MAQKKSEVEKVIEAAEKTPVPAPANGFMPPVFDDPDWNIDEFERASSEIWRPDEGEFVLGFYDEAKPLPKEYSEYDEDVMVHFIIEKDTKNRVSFVGGQMCDKFIAESPITKSTPVFIRYMGQGSTRKGNKVNNYDIRFKA